jgi:hypothetical protein
MIGLRFVIRTQLFYLVPHPDRFCVPPFLLSNEYGGFMRTGDKVTGA